MKKQYYVISALMMLSVFAATGKQNQAEAAEKKTKLEQGTLTISGKGVMPEKLKVKNKNKVKKVVIKRGITTISNSAFKNYKNLKTVVIPKSVKKIGWDSFSGTAIQKLTVPASVTSIGQNSFSGMTKLEKLTVPGNFTIKTKVGDDCSYTICNKVDTVEFNTPLNLKRAAAFTSNNYLVKKSDSKYKSIGGVIYSKDGKSLVRVPYQRKELVIDNGCEHFALQAVLASNKDNEGDPADGCQLEKITIPSSVKRVESKQYAGLIKDEKYKNSEQSTLTVDIQTKQLDGNSLNELMVWLGIKPEEMQKQLPGQISLENNMYLSNDGILLKYVGDEKEVTVPSTVKKIGGYAFYRKQAVEQVKMPESVAGIGDAAFEMSGLKTLTLPKTLTSLGDYVFANTKITEIQIPEGLKTIPAGMFSGCALKKIVIPDSVEKIGNGAFCDCQYVTEIQMGKSVKEIGESSFNGTVFTNLTLPASVTKVGSQAFGNDGGNAPKSRIITVNGSSKGINPFAFKAATDQFIYQNSNKEMRTFFDSSYGNLKKLKASVTFRWNKVKGASGYQVVFSADSKFKKGKKITLKQSKKKATVTLNIKKSQVKKTTYHRGVNVYGKIRPYKVVNGKKVYGRWTVNTFSCDEY